MSTPGRQQTAGTAGGPVFVVGSMRSGSTMLRLILDSHPDIAIGPETGFMRAVQATKRIPDFRFGEGWYEQLGWSETEFDERLREFYDGIFRRYAHAQGKPRWGEKTPFHTLHIDEMAQVFPDAVFLGIVRHPGAVAVSLRKNFHYEFGQAVRYWMATNLALIRSGAGLGPRFLLCRYEDLVLHAEPVLREVVEFLGEPWHPAVLEHHRVQRERGAPRAVEGGTITRDPIDGGRVAEWVDGVGADDRRALTAAADLAGLLGYHPTRADAAERLPMGDAPARWTRTGTDLDACRALWAGLEDPGTGVPANTTDTSPEILAERLARAEQTLRRVRSRRAVRLADALRRIQHGRSFADLRAAWTALRRSAGGGDAGGR
jgi:hypothetical protein